MLDGDDDAAGVSALGGSNTADDSASEGAVHFVAVVIEDIAGNKLADHRVAIATPDGRRSPHKLTSGGAARVDNIRADGEAVVQLLDAEIRPPVKLPVAPWIGFTVVDEDGQPLEGVDVEITTPDGATLTVRTGPRGAVRIDNLKEDGECEVRVLAADGADSADVDDADEAAGETNEGDGADETGGAEATPGGDESSDDSEVSEEPQKRLFLLEVPDVLCRTSSCVILPEGEAPSSSPDHPAISGVNIFAAAIRLGNERPHFKLLIGAHTDSVDTTEDNHVLSQERGKMALALLMGDRESYKALAHARHRISDIKQMLHWCAMAYPDAFSCNPGVIDDRDNLWGPVHTFENEFNYSKGRFGADATPDLELTGSMGPKNWGALFDVLQFALAEELEVTVEELAPLRAKLQWLDDDRKALGFSEHHPIDEVGRDNYDSQANRRVELLFFDENDILPDVAAAEADPANSEIYLPGIYERERIPVGPGSPPPSEQDEDALIIPFVPDDEEPPEESVGLDHTVAGQTVGSTRPGQPGVRYDSEARLLFIKLQRSPATPIASQLVYFGARFWDGPSQSWLIRDSNGNTVSADEPLDGVATSPFQSRSVQSRGLFGGEDEEDPLGEVFIHQADAFGFPRTFDAADESNGRYNVARNNWWASKSSIIEGLEDARRGDIFIFFGHATPRSEGSATASQRHWWSGRPFEKRLPQDRRSSTASARSFRTMRPFTSKSRQVSIQT